MFVSGRAHLSDVPAMVQRFQEWGVPFPTLNVYVSGLTECACGLLLLVGFASRLITIPLIINFCVAYLTASREVLLSIFNDPDAFVSDVPSFLLSARLCNRFHLRAGRVLGRRPYHEACSSRRGRTKPKSPVLCAIQNFRLEPRICVTKKRILILGGGFGGVYVAVHLGKLLSRRELEETEIALVNRENYIVFQPLLPEVISAR